MFQQPMGHVDTETVDATIEPKRIDSVELSSHSRIAPVQVWLLWKEQVAVVLAAVVIERPRAAAKVTDPIVRRASISLGVAKQVIVAFGRCWVGDRCLKPPVLRRCVIGHNVKDDLHIELMCTLNHGIDIRKGAVLWVDVAVERHVVAMIMSGRR